VVTVRVSLVRSGAAGCMRGFLQKRKARSPGCGFVRARLGREGLVAQVWLDYFGRAPGERVYVVHAWVRAFVLPGSCVRCELGQMGEMARERERGSKQGPREARIT
jgi:hypothetical protein